MVLAGLLLLSGCTSIQQKNKFGDFEQAIVDGRTLDAMALAELGADIDETTGEADDLLWSLQAAALMRQEKIYSKSNRLFDSAEAKMKGEDTKHLLLQGAELAGSMLLNDSITSYQQSQYDGVMVNTYKALNFMAEGDYANARIEWNRTEDRQRRAAEHFAKKITAQQEELAKEEEKVDQENINRSLEAASPLLQEQGVDLSQWNAYEGYVNPFATYLHGLYFMLKAQDKSDYSKARDSFKRVYGLTRNADVKVDMNMANSLLQGRNINKHKPAVWVVFENGLGAKKEEFRIDLPLFVLTSNVSYSGIALPKLVERSPAYSNLQIGRIKTRPLANMDRIIQAEFKSEFPYILSREVIRATLKTVAQKQVQDKSPLLGMVAGIAQAASTGADIRGWTTLPKEWQLARINRPNNGKLKITAPELSLPLEVELDANSRFHLVYVKAAAPLQQPEIEVINL
ncbi:COG3014 family protein [Oceanisphaera sp. KMM 10153]|uniref:COG3014 family protein n=1 Tax=Oceanisphaera submarina TaxID=3390193 RepID=UPI0039761396